MDSVRDVDHWLTELQAHRDRLKAELRRVERLLTAAKEVDADMTPTGNRRPSVESMLGQITKVFEEAPEAEFTAEEVWQRIKDAGVGGEAADPVNSVRGSLSRLKKRKVVEDVRRGVFRLRRAEPVVPPSVGDPWTQPANDPWNQPTSDPWKSPSGRSDDPPF